jgi:protein MpaA
LLQGRRVVFLPIANPDGYVHNVRTNSHGIDLNRNFGASNRQDLRRYGTELSEPESTLIAAVLKQYKPVRIVSIHQPLSCIDYDGPAEQLAQLMAKYCELPVKLVGSRPGSLGSYAGVDLGIPIVTLELPRTAGSLTAPEVWRRYGVALLASITYPAQPVPISVISPLEVLALFAALGCLAVVLLVLVRRKNRSRGAV